MSDVRGSNPVPAQAGAQQLLVCFAVREEAQFFVAPTKPATDVLITGIGARNASTTVQDYLSRQLPCLVLTCGFAGGLNPVHPLGQVLFDDTHAGSMTTKLSSLGAQPGRFVQSDRIVVSAREKAQLFETSGADAVEMESSAILNLCRERGIPVLVLRVISDTATEDLPMDFNRFSLPDGGLSMPRLLSGIARSPSTVPKLIKFQGRLKQAAKNLGTTLERLLASGDLF